MAHAISETDRRRELQIDYNTRHNIDPTPLRKKIADITSVLAREKADSEDLLAGVKNAAGEGYSRSAGLKNGPEELGSLIATLTDQMMQASGELKFELAGKLRDEVRELKKELREMSQASS